MREKMGGFEKRDILLVNASFNPFSKCNIFIYPILEGCMG
jgi:hypothetical protein